MLKLHVDFADMQAQFVGRFLLKMAIWLVLTYVQSAFSKALPQIVLELVQGITSLLKLLLSFVLLFHAIPALHACHCPHDQHDLTWNVCHILSLLTTWTTGNCMRNTVRFVVQLFLFTHSLVSFMMGWKW